MKELQHAAEVSAAKVAPPIAVASAAAAGVSLQEWVYIVTIAYVVLQIGVLVYTFGARKSWWNWK